MGTVGLHALAALARHTDLIVTAWVLDGASAVLVFVLLIAFQSELRHALMQVDAGIRGHPSQSERDSVSAVSEAAFELAESGNGALLVLVRRDPVSELTSGGVPFGGQVSPELLETIFQKRSPLHDGAAILDGDRLDRAGVLLPLTQESDLPRSYGTRHHAAAGLAERCDAVVVAVSEERGEVTVMTGRTRSIMSSRADLEKRLTHLLARRREPWASRALHFFTSSLRLKAAALALTAVTWCALTLLAGSTVRTFNVPIEFTNVPAGAEVISQSVAAVQVQARGSAWLINSVDPSTLVAQLDLSGNAAGTHALRVTNDSVNLPSGVTTDRVLPAVVTIRLGPA
ncbi:MAG: diadenylate cyclase [Bryobacteraceae bacterium]